MISLFLLSVLASGCTQQKAMPLAIPSEYQHAKDMLEQLQKEGLHIQEINNSKYTAIFNTNPNYSMFLTTDRGIFELVHLEHKNGKEIDIVEETNDNGANKYVIRENGVDQVVILGHESYINKSDEYLTIARDKGLNDKIKQALNAQ